MENHEDPDVEGMGFHDDPIGIASFTEYFSTTNDSKLKDGWPDLESALEKHGLSGTLNLDEGFLTVSTTAKTRDPDMIDKARDFTLLLAKTLLPAHLAIRVLNGELHYAYIKTGYQYGGLCSIHGIKKKRFVKQRKRFVDHIKDFVRLIGCSIYINDDTVATTALTFNQVKLVRNIVIKCFVENVHPAAIVKKFYHSKQELATQKLEALHV